MDTAFAEAVHLTGKYIAEPERASMLGQFRHARCEAGFRSAALSAGLSPQALHTEPTGSRYSLISNNGVYLIRGNVQTHCGLPRLTRFRRELANLNRWLNPLQINWLQEVEPPPADKLCGIIVVTAYRNRNIDQTGPAFLGLGIPYDDLSDWYILKPITALLAEYHDMETRQHTPKEASIEVKDRAIPRLKTRQNKPPEAEE